MTAGEAAQVLETLLRGIDPTTGEVIDEGPLAEPTVMRALFVALEALRRAPKDRPAQTMPDRAGKPWSATEDSELIDEYRSGRVKSELAKLHSRTRGAIASRLVKLGEVSATDQVK